MTGGMRSCCTPPGLRAVSHAQRPASATIPHQPRTTRTCRIIAPGYFPVLGVTRSSMMCGVIRIKRSRRSSCSWEKPNSLPRSGRSTRNGIPVFVTVTEVTVRPPMTAVSPSLTRIWLSACCVWNVKPMSTDEGFTAEFSACTSISTWRFAVTCGVTLRLMPVCSNRTVARGGAFPPLAELTSITGIGTLDQLVEELGLGAEIVLEPELLHVGAVHEDDLRLNRHLRCADIEALDEILDPADAARDLGDDEGVGGRIGDGLAALREDGLDRRHQRRGAGVVDAHQARLDRYSRVGPRQVFLVDDLDDAALEGGGRGRLRLEHRREREVPGLVLDLGGHRSLDVLREHDGAAAERGEAGDHLANVGIVPRDGDPGRLRLLALALVGGEVGVDRELGAARGGGGGPRRFPPPPRGRAPRGRARHPRPTDPRR